MSTRLFKCGVVAASVGAAVVAAAAPRSFVSADDCVQPPSLHWPHSGWFNSLDHHSVRRGYQVYREVCSACHSMRFLCYRNLVNVTHSESEAKAIAEEAMIEDGPNEEGEMFERPGKLSDRFPNPYKNESAAKAANNGAIPPDLSYITSARKGGEDYVFHLLTGYRDPPAGMEIGDGQYYNPYMTGGLIAMTPPLSSEAVEYEDGTPNSLAQLVKDVCCFLRWAAEPEFDDRKRKTMKALSVLCILSGFVFYIKRHVWSLLKSQKMFYYNPRGSSTYDHKAPGGGKH